MSSGIVYNQTWEDPTVDSEALQINSRDVVLTISSGGCNVLNLALENPLKIFSIDRNPSQNQLLKLKISAASHLNYEDFWSLFGEGRSDKNLQIYNQKLRIFLDKNSTTFWDKNVSIFKTGLYNEGQLGSLRILRKCIYILCGKKNILNLLNSRNLDEQKKYYLSKIKPRLWNILTRYIISPTMVIYGVHLRQIYFVLKAKQYFLKDMFENRIDYILTSIPLRTNYFWQQILGGGYGDNFPAYLHEESFTELKKAVDKIEVRTCSMIELLKQKEDDSISKFNLLDMPEFLSTTEMHQLWHEIYRVAKNNAILIYRSFSPNFFIDTDLLNNFHYFEEESKKFSQREMTASYNNFYKYSISKNHAS
jgi:S-adenosylmethionine-diacylglycerol 3-amino-3-carboxypropyl transferase